MAFPGGVQTLEWAHAFEETGHASLAHELFEAAISRLDSTEALQPELYAGWARFLIRQHDLDSAESFLMRMNWALPAQSAQLVFELYQAWGKLADLTGELPKFHLPTGVVKEVQFLARQNAESTSSRP